MNNDAGSEARDSSFTGIRVGDVQFIAARRGNLVVGQLGLKVAAKLSASACNEDAHQCAYAW
jgi:hypothetical protein